MRVCISVTNMFEDSSFRSHFAQGHVSVLGTHQHVLSSQRQNGQDIANTQVRCEAYAQDDVQTRVDHRPSNAKDLVASSQLHRNSRQSRQKHNRCRITEKPQREACTTRAPSSDDEGTRVQCHPNIEGDGEEGSSASRGHFDNGPKEI